MNAFELWTCCQSLSGEMAPPGFSVYIAPSLEYEVENVVKKAKFYLLIWKWNAEVLSVEG